MSQNLEQRQLVRQNKKIELFGLDFYPIKMSDYESFLICKDALILRIGTLPVKYLSYDFLTALFMLEIDSVKRDGKNVGLFDRVIRLLHLSLRIEYDAKEFARHGIVLESKDGDVKIAKIAVTQNGKTVEITPRQFSSKIRPLIAAQNALELPNEKENIDLVRAAEKRKEIENRGKSQLKFSIDDLISSVAYQSRVTEKEIYEWPVREFENRKKAISRDKQFMLCGQAEMSGMVTFSKGNPAPSWCFDVVDDSLGTVSFDELQKSMKGVEQKSEKE